MTQPNVDFRSELAGHATALRSLAQRLVSNADAEDLTHDAMVTALAQPQRPRRLRPWLRQVLRNEARARHRSDSRRTAREGRVELGAEPASAEALADLAQMATAVQEALVDLDPPYRRVLEARFYDERTAADIARSEGCPAGTVRWRVQEGLRRVRSSLDARFEGREAWRGRMAALAVAPLSWAGPPPGEAPMISSSLFTKLALGALATAAAVGVVATSSSSQHAAEQPPEPASFAAASTSVPPAAQPSSQALHAPTSVETPASQPVPAVPPADPTCETCAADTGLIFQDLDRCFGEFEVSEGGRVDVHVELDELTVRAVEVRSDNEADADLVACLEETMPGTEVGFEGDGEPPASINLTFFPETVRIPETIDQPTPMEMADAGSLPMRSEGQRPTRTLVACADYDCPFCDKARVTMDQLLDEHPDVQLAWMHMPLPSHPRATVAAQAAVAAAAQGKFWELHELLFAEPDARSDADLRRMAAEAGLDMARFERDWSDPATAAVVEDQRSSCEAAGAQATPAFFIDDTVLVGAQPIESFRNLLQ